MLYDNLTVNGEGHLCIAGVSCVTLAETYGTPLYVMDEGKIRENCRAYREAIAEEFGPESHAAFAGKALCFKGIYPILQEEGMFADVVSPGELFTALAAGYPPEQLFFHGNNKTDADIQYGVESRVGCFVVDNENELEILNACAGERGVVQKVLLRLSPGIDSHTLEAINTGRIDCQFGSPIETGQAMDFLARALRMEHLDVQGFHSHIGSQIFGAKPFCDALDILMHFADAARTSLGFVARSLNLGGGFGVRYVEEDPEVDIPGNIKILAAHLAALCAEYGYPKPAIFLEPGRSIVANAGLTLYTAGGVKNIEGYRKYVTVDGGMTDNPRYALYGSPYTILSAARMQEKEMETVTIAGRCCESGDLIAEHVPLPAPKRGDLIAVLTTGAYNFSMSSNYNRLCRPALVMIRDATPRLAVRRQTFEDLIACEL